VGFYKVVGWATFDRLHLNNKNKKMLFYFVLSSICTTFAMDSAEICICLKNNVEWLDEDF